MNLSNLPSETMNTNIQHAMRHKIDCIVLDDRITNKWGLPEHKTPGSAGIDLFAALDETITLAPGEVQLLPTGVKIHIGDPSLVGFLLPRSSLGHKKGIILGNGTGVIDSDYQGQTMVSVWNRSETPFVVEPGERICQMVFVRVAQVELNVVSEFEESDRGEGGFGSTNKQ